MKNKICIIIVWFGKFPDYFKLWEMSCAYNKNITDFLLVTDQLVEHESPNINVNDKMNHLYQQKGTLFDYKTVFTSNANYAFCKMISGLVKYLWRDYDEGCFISGRLWNTNIGRIAI